jgi:hypothetical protein
MPPTAPKTSPVSGESQAHQKRSPLPGDASQSKPSQIRPDLYDSRREGGTMWWGIGIGGFILYVLLLFFLGIRTLRNGHGWLFFFGIFFPLLWLIGAFLQPSPQAA